MNGKLRPKQEQAIAALLSTPNHAEAAAAIGISDTTLWRWLNDPDFQNAYRAARRRAVDGAVAQLQALTGSAVATLRDLIESANTPATNRVSAARVVLDQAFRATQMEALEERIEELEEGPGNRKRGGGAMDIRSLRRRIRRLERAIKPKAARPGTCVGVTFHLYEGDPGVTVWDSSGVEGGSNEPEANNVEPAEVADVDVDDIAPKTPPEEIP